MSLNNTKGEKIEPMIANIHKLLDKKEKVIIAIDGRCASGKTSLANWIQKLCLVPSRVLHMDDFYLPIASRTEDWEHKIAGNMDIERFLNQALIPASQKKEIVYEPFSCKKGALLEPRLLEYCPLTIIEGSYALHPRLISFYDLKIFLSCNKQVQMQRIKEREGEGYIQFENRWIPMEELYFQSLNIEQICDYHYDTSC